MWEESFAELSIVAARQQGFITGDQAERVGVGQADLDHFTETRLIMELDWGVYQLSSSSVGPRHAYPYAAWLAIRPGLFGWERAEKPFDAVLSHESACNLHGIGSLSAPSLVFTATEEYRAPRATTIHVGELAEGDAMTTSGVPVTTPHRTLLDLVRGWAEHGDVSRAVTDAVLRDLIDLREFHRDMVPLAAEHEFPDDGREFAEYFTPLLPLESLSPRNLRAYVGLISPERVEQVGRRVTDILAEARLTAGGGTADARDEPLARDLAAEIVGRLGFV
jgi:hypothetical protein